jgi:hypothetical protein
MMKVVRTRCTLAAIPINTAIALRGYFMMFSTVKWPVAVAMILKPVWIPIVMDAMEQMACKLFRIQCSAESAPPAEYAGGQSRGKWKTGEKARRV